MILISWYGLRSVLLPLQRYNNFMIYANLWLFFAFFFTVLSCSYSEDTISIFFTHVARFACVYAFFVVPLQRN